MDHTRGAYARMRSLYGATPGTYRIDVFGAEETDYELTVLVAGSEGTIVDDTMSAHLELGDLHAYEVTIPGDGSGTGTGEIDPTGEEWLRPALAGGAGMAGGIAIGGPGYRTLQRRRTDPD